MKNETKNIKLACDISFCQLIQVKPNTEGDAAWDLCSVVPVWDDEHYDYRLVGRPTFDLDLALKGSRFCTRDGQEAKFLVYAEDAHNEAYPVIMVINGETFNYTIRGCYHLEVDSDMDLFLIPTVRTYWVNLYANGVSAHFESEAAADNDDAERSIFRVGRQAWPIEIAQPLFD